MTFMSGYKRAADPCRSFQYSQHSFYSTNSSMFASALLTPEPSELTRLSLDRPRDSPHQPLTAS